MTRFLRIVIFTLLIAAIVFFGFRASQPIEEITHSADQQNINTSTAAAPAEKVIPPELQDLSTQEAIKKENNTNEADKAIDR